MVKSVLLWHARGTPTAVIEGFDNECVLKVTISDVGRSIATGT